MHFLVCLCFLAATVIAGPLSTKDLKPFHLMNLHFSENKLKPFKDDSYIVGGRPATAGEVPYIVSLQRPTHFCGGTIIGSQFIITAAHCVSGSSPSSINIRYNTLKHNSGGLMVKLSAIYAHEQYDSWTIDNDIALLKTASLLDLNSGATAAVLPAQGSEPTSGKVKVSGWGALYEGSGGSVDLMTVDLDIVDRATCKNAYGGTTITDNMFCVGDIQNGGEDACQGDSGGPAVVDNVLVGAVSWGYGCARPGYPGVKTRVGSYIDWIKSKQAL